jgi:PIN domain nuclease of toxin-antitoxin system
VILLDTHTVVWLTGNPAKLSVPAAAAIAEARKGSRGVALSGHTLWEIAMLSDRGRITLPAPLPTFLRYLESMFTIHPITAAVAEQAVAFTNAYPKDPSDRLIGATAIAHGLRLVTMDAKIIASGEVSCIW